MSRARLADFARWLGTEFRVADLAGAAIALELVEARPLPAHRGRRDPSRPP